MSTSGLIDCIAVSYGWFLAPVDINDYDLTLVLASCRCSFSPCSSVESLHAAWKALPIEKYCYHATLPWQEMPLSAGDVSGTIGLLWSPSSKISEKKAAAFERLVSDAAMWCLDNYDFIPSDNQIVVIIQGPMLPKLRGRLLYRAVHPGVSVYALTYQPEWLKRIQDEQGQLESEEGSDVAGVVVGAVHPPVGIDHGTRDWMCRSESHDSYHFELITNTWSCCEHPDWLAERQAEIGALLKATVLDEDILIPLPGPLARVTQEVREIIKMEKSFLTILREHRKYANAGTLPRPKHPFWAVHNVLYGKGAEQSSTLELIAASKTVIPCKPDDLYERFMNEYHTLSTLPEFKALRRKDR